MGKRLVSLREILGGNMQKLPSPFPETQNPLSFISPLSLLKMPKCARALVTAYT